MPPSTGEEVVKEVPVTRGEVVPSESLGKEVSSDATSRRRATRIKSATMTKKNKRRRIIKAKKALTDVAQMEEICPIPEEKMT